MSRKKIVNKRQISSDYKYNCLVVAKFINYLMKDGKKSIARKIVYGALDLLEGFSDLSPVEMFRTSINNLSPDVEVKSKKVGGTRYQIPISISSNRSHFVGASWLLHAARKRKESTMHARLANEIKDVLRNRGTAVKKKEELYRIVAANKSFAHFR